ncbi:hypothetical protein [Paenibacillus sp. HJGM_3]|uniref:hypothetical protein n=1 Tax=Paenibacillus sp. HJGM_3 TaxID=3379816 RepID=UPI00385A6E03
MKKIVIGVFGVALVTSWVGNLWYYHAQELEKPLFLRHYYEIRASSLERISFYYLSNKDMNQKPAQIMLPDNTLLNVMHVEQRAERGRLQLNEAIATVVKTTGNSQTASITANQMTVFYNHGLIDTVPIGTILVHPLSDQRNDYPLQMQGSGGSSDGSGYSASLAARDLTLVSFQSSFPERISDALEIEVEGRNASTPGLFPITLAKDERFEMRYQFRLPPSDARRYDAYNLMIAYKEAGTDSFAAAQFVNIQPQLYEEDLARYVRLRKEESQ